MAVVLTPVWRESRLAFEHAALRRDPVYAGEGIPHGDGEPVLLVPGFLAGDISLGVLAGWLRRIGYHAHGARIRINADCATRIIDRLEERVEELAERHNTRVAIIGQSRGGSLSRVIALRRPDLVSGVACLGSPVVDELAVNPLVLVQLRVLDRLSRFGVPGLLSRACFDGECCAPTRELAKTAFPAGVGFVVIYSRSDGIVDWRACLDPAAEHVEIDASHCGMAVHADAYRALAHALASFASSERQRLAA